MSFEQLLPYPWSAGCRLFFFYFFVSSFFLFFLHPVMGIWAGPVQWSRLGHIMLGVKKKLEWLTHPRSLFDWNQSKWETQLPLSGVWRKSRENRPGRMVCMYECVPCNLYNGTTAQRYNRYHRYLCIIYLGRAEWALGPTAFGTVRGRQ